MQNRWEEYYDQKLLHPNELKAASIMNELINLAVEYYMQDREEILTSARFTTLQVEEDYFRGSYIRDFHNICRRKYQKSIGRDINEPIAPRQQINLAAARDAEEALPDA